MIKFVTNKMDKNVNQIISIASKKRIDSERVGKLSALADLVQQAVISNAGESTQFEL